MRHKLIMLLLIPLLMLFFLDCVHGYHVYAEEAIGSITLASGMGSFIDKNDNMGRGADKEYLVFHGYYSGTGYLFIYEVITSGDPQQHPMDGTGPITARNFILVDQTTLEPAYPMENGFVIKDDGIYYGASYSTSCAINKWDFDLNDQGCEITQRPPISGTEVHRTLAYDEINDYWWAGTAPGGWSSGGKLYRWDGTNWEYQFTHPGITSMGQRGLEIVNDNLFIADSNNHAIIQYKINSNGRAVDDSDRELGVDATADPNAYENKFYRHWASSWYLIYEMGFGPNEHMWAARRTGWMGAVNVYEIGGQSIQDEFCVPEAEVCDGMDNDCDGLIDSADPDLPEGPDCTRNTATCQTNKDICVCWEAKQECTGGVWVDCSNADYLSYNSSYESTESTCDDSLDNDCDISIDCSDSPDCDPDPACAVPEDCSTPGDEDGNGLSDCCDPVCICTEICGNGLDDDCDGDTDCADPECAPLAPPCPKQDGVCAGSKRSCNTATGNWLPGCSTLNYTNHNPAYELSESDCFDGLDTDCDGLRDCELGLVEPGCPCEKLVISKIVYPTPINERTRTNITVTVSNQGTSNSHEYNITIKEEGNPIYKKERGKVTAGSADITAISWEPAGDGNRTIRVEVVNTSNGAILTFKEIDILVGKLSSHSADEYSALALILVLVLVPMIAYYAGKPKPFN